MTFQEGFKQAMREMGYSEKEITDRVNCANMCVPIGKESLDAQIIPGCEREFVEWLKKVAEFARANAGTVKSYVEQRLVEKMKQN